MTYLLADNILSPLGETTDQNLRAVVAGRSALKTYSGKYHLPEPFCAALFTETNRPGTNRPIAVFKETNRPISVDWLTAFEAMVLCSIKQTVAQTAINLSSPRVVLVLSTTKGNIETLGDARRDPHESLPGHAAEKIASLLGMVTSPIVVCNACISGVSALILASRLLESDAYDKAIVCGADCQGAFIVSGFQSLKAISASPCKPFDIERIGLNLGEAVSTVILGKNPPEDRSPEQIWRIEQGAVRNDAYHISAPSKKGEGAYRTLQAVTKGGSIDDIALINAHGTATLFNDQMESVAIERAGLSSVPVNAYKGFFGHTMGAAGILETVLTMKALDQGIIIGTKNFEEPGVSGRIHIVKDNQSTDKSRFIKMISGFGGNNASILLAKGTARQETVLQNGHHGSFSGRVTHHVVITPDQVEVDGRRLAVEKGDTSFLTALYKRYIDDYPKFYKMDMLCRLGFVASELLLQAEGDSSHEGLDDRAVILFNRSSSLASDIKYQATISDADNFFPSPSLFVYTLPNIVTGEIALRHHYYGETSFFILPERDNEQMDRIVQAEMLDPATSSVLTGWVDYEQEDQWIADLKIIE